MTVLVEKEMTYYGRHVPSGEDWVILGVDVNRAEVCVAGWPATIGKFSDIINLYPRHPRTLEEAIHVKKHFGESFLN